MNESTIHPTAVVSDEAVIGPGASIGPGVVIAANVEIGANCSFGPHAVVHQHTRMGDSNTVSAHAVLGGEPQHAGYDGSDTSVVIGDNNVFREFVTVNRAYLPGAETRIGSNCLFMANTHVGHDTIVGNNVVLTNAALLAGHVEVGDNVVMGAAAGAHQFLRIGSFSMVGGYAPLRKDVLPYCLIGGTPVRHYRLNTVGLRRNGIKGDRYRALEQAFKALRDGNRSLDDVPDTEEVLSLREWLSVKSKYGHYGFAAPKR